MVDINYGSRLFVIDKALLMAKLVKDLFLHLNSRLLGLWLKLLIIIDLLCEITFKGHKMFEIAYYKVFELFPSFPGNIDGAL
jgi:hypothetical protein